MGMQRLKTKIRKRKYKLGALFGRDGDDVSGASSAFTNAGCEWQFENFSPRLPTRNEDSACAAVEIVDDSPPPSPVPQRYGILSYFPRRPSSWTPNCTAAPPVPPHAWQIQRTGSQGARKDHPSAIGSNPDLKRSMSSIDEKQQQHSSDWDIRHSSTFSHDPFDSSCRRRADSRNARFAVDSAVATNQYLLESKPSSLVRRDSYQVKASEPIYSKPQRPNRSKVEHHRPAPPTCPTTHGCDDQRSTSSSSHLTVAADSHLDDASRSNQRPHSANRSIQSSPLSMFNYTDMDIPPPVPPHAPGVVCTPIGQSIVGKRKPINTRVDESRFFVFVFFRKFLSF